jgi:hypothetical protein
VVPTVVLAVGTTSILRGDVLDVPWVRQDSERCDARARWGKDRGRESAGRAEALQLHTYS